MSDNDRITTIYDEKQRVLDLTEYKFVPPDVGMYDAPFVFYKANLQWAKIIEGHVSWLATVAAWPDAQGENYQAIQEIYQFLERVEMMPVEDLKGAISDGIYQAFNDLAKQVVSGTKGGFSVDEDGNVVVGGEASRDDDLPNDDPETEIDEFKSSKNGGVIAIRRGLNDIFKTLDTWYGTDATEDMTVTNAQYYFKQKYNVDSAKADIAVNEWWTARAALSPVPSDMGVGLDQKLFCKGVTKQNVISYILDGSLPKPLTIFVADAVNEAQYDTWFNFGLETPSLAYIGYSCTPIATEEFTLDMSTSNNPSYVTSGLWKEGHRYLIEVSGTYQDADLPNLRGDAMYFEALDTGIKTFSVMNFNYDGSITTPTQVQVPFQPSHVYAFTIEKNVGSGNSTRTISRDNGSMTIPNVTGILTVKITDLGEFSV